VRIESLRIENFRGFADVEIPLDNYTCFVGRNGSGKSTVLHALNVFFRQNKDVSTDLSRLSTDDFHHKRTDRPIRITVTFSDLSPEAESDLKDYVRQGKLIVSAKAEFNPQSGTAEVRQYGSRLGIDRFRSYFEAEKRGATAPDLKTIFAELRGEFPEIQAAASKADMAAALQQFEGAHPEKCAPIESEDQFYGATKGANRLAPHVQWIFVSATKDVSEEAEESKTSALGQLLARTIRSRINFSDKVRRLREEAQSQYHAMLELEQSALDDLSKSVQTRLRNWAHPQTTAAIRWRQDPEKSVRIEEPAAMLHLGERGFSSELARFGHGLQRSYLLTLLQELATIESESEPTLVMAIEEPELYQHPPQARYLAEVLRTLSSSGNSQVLCCSHSPLFIPGDGFEAVRLVRDVGTPCSSSVSQVRYSDLAATLARAGDRLLTESGIMAKLHPELNPVLSEMFFCSRLVLVEGIEDVAYISAGIELTGLGDEFRKWGCHIVPAGGKSAMVKPLAIASLLGIPTFAVFDADTGETRPGPMALHKKDNRALQILLGVATPVDWPSDDLEGTNYRIWAQDITSVVPASVGPEWSAFKSAAEARYGQPGGLEKNPMAVAYALQQAWSAGKKCEVLERLVQSIVAWAEHGHG